MTNKSKSEIRRLEVQNRILMYKQSDLEYIREYSEKLKELNFELDMEYIEQCLNNESEEENLISLILEQVHVIYELKKEINQFIGKRTIV